MKPRAIALDDTPPAELGFEARHQQTLEAFKRIGNGAARSDSRTAGEILRDLQAAQRRIDAERACLPDVMLARAPLLVVRVPHTMASDERGRLVASLARLGKEVVAVDDGERIGQSDVPPGSEFRYACIGSDGDVTTYPRTCVHGKQMGEWCSVCRDYAD